MGLATACTAIVCALLLLYLAAYAHVTQLGIDQAQARTQLRQNQLRNALLQAECNSLESPQRIAAAAARHREWSRAAQRRLTMLRPEKKQDSPDAKSRLAGSRGGSGGTTEDSGAAAFGDH